VLSHWHRDHSGGILPLLKLLKSERGDAAEGSLVTLDLHPDRPIARGIAPPPYTKVTARLPDDPTFADMEAAGARLELRREAHVVGDGAVWVSGEIPRVTAFEGGLLGGVRWFEDADGAGAWREEPHIMDERYAVVDVLGKGLVVFSACSHAGIVNVVRDAVDKFSRPIHMVIGGLHLAGPELVPRIPPTVDFLSRQLRPSPTYVLPLHCSGFPAKVALEKALGEGCVPGGVGMKIQIQGDAKGEESMFAPCVS